jgi:hypothetical protein
MLAHKKNKRFVFEGGLTLRSLSEECRHEKNGKQRVGFFDIVFGLTDYW